MMSDTCVLIYGRIRSWKESYESFRHSLDNFNYDIYCSLNVEFDDSDALEYSKMPFVKKVMCMPTPFPEVLKHVDRNVVVAHRENIFSANFHRYMSFKNSIDDKKYDRYIFYRADILTESQIPKLIPENNTLYCPKKYRYGMRDSGETHYIGNEEILNDQIMICNYDVACVIADTYINIFDLYSRNIPFHPETLLMNQCVDFGVEFKYFDFDYELNPNRLL